ncbi:MAG: hypothetical protein KAU24_01365 [Candidatus Aenigmarchaeota archaeon]|nr:hypothetical protein [Candidatus Aenigmarchaeota archaeon]
MGEKKLDKIYEEARNFYNSLKSNKGKKHFIDEIVNAQLQLSMNHISSTSECKNQKRLI